jgi:hypothetical protein
MEVEKKRAIESLEAEIKLLEAERDDLDYRIRQKERDIDIIKNPMRHIRMTAYFDCRK